MSSANASLRNHGKIWAILGNLEPTVAARTESFDVLKEDSDAGRERRQALQDALQLLDREEHGLGIEMNQRYDSTAVYKSDQKDMPPLFTTDPLEHYHPTTFPGARLPHVWLSRTIPSKPISTIDLAGKGRFALFTGIGGQAWRTTTAKLSSDLGIPITTYSIGFRQEYEDRYMDWVKMRGVGESGCVLVRPDYFVAWRSQQWEQHSAEKLEKVLRSILSCK